VTTTSGTHTSSLPAWIGVLTGPAAWTVHLWFNYGLGEFLACTPAAQGRPEFLGIDVRVWVVASNAVLAAVTLAAALWSLARYRRLRATDPTPGRWTAWMALAAVMLNALFVIVIASGIAPGVILDACTRSP
jgi:hypothetical protein